MPSFCRIKLSAQEPEQEFAVQRLGVDPGGRQLCVRGCGLDVGAVSAFPARRQGFDDLQDGNGDHADPGPDGGFWDRLRLVGNGSGQSGGRGVLGCDASAGHGRSLRVGRSRR